MRGFFKYFLTSLNILVSGELKRFCAEFVMYTYMGQLYNATF